MFYFRKRGWLWFRWGWKFVGWDTYKLAESYYATTGTIRGSFIRGYGP